MFLFHVKTLCLQIPLKILPRVFKTSSKTLFRNPVWDSSETSSRNYYWNFFTDSFNKLSRDSDFFFPNITSEKSYVGFFIDFTRVDFFRNFTKNLQENLLCIDLEIVPSISSEIPIRIPLEVASKISPRIHLENLPIDVLCIQ